MILAMAYAVAVWGQAIPICPLSPADIFLGFDCGSSQRQTISRNNDDHLKWREQKERRIHQVRSEIADETQRSPLDSTALGLRYAEVEAICREIDEREMQLVRVNRDVLNEAQKAKLTVLEDAMKLMPVASSAVSVNLIHAAPINGLRGGNSFADVLLGHVSQWPAKQRTGACASIPTPAILGIPAQQ